VFAGIVRGTGRVAAVADLDGSRRIEIDCAGVPLGQLGAGASLAVNGCCLTALEDVDGIFRADASAETLGVTTLGQLAPGDTVNLEPSLRLGDPVDGHLVYGHVDDIGRVRSIAPVGSSIRVSFDVPGRLGRFLAVKGSVAVDGVSLTINAVDADGFTVNVIPHTREMTIFGDYEPGTTVNIEVDMMARYAERLAATDAPDQPADPGGITIEMLKEHGFTGGN
jgi:riboflavin synthase